VGCGRGLEKANVDEERGGACEDEGGCGLEGVRGPIEGVVAGEVRGVGYGSTGWDRVGQRVEVAADGDTSVCGRRHFLCMEFQYVGEGYVVVVFPWSRSRSGWSSQWWSRCDARVDGIVKVTIIQLVRV